MEMLALLGSGFEYVFRPENLLLVFLGCFIGTMIGMLPGLGGSNAVAILLPLVFAVQLEPAAALILFAGIYYGSEYGNSISAILLNIPGTSGAVATTFDGYPMARNGKAGAALAMSAVASFTGGTISVVGLMLLAPQLAKWALHFGPAEYFVLIIFALTMVAALTQGDLVKGLIAGILGLMVSTVGLDPAGTSARFTFGSMKLYDGIDFVVVMIGLFAVGEVLLALERSRARVELVEFVTKARISFAEIRGAMGTMVRSSVLGFGIGALPGAGATIASFLGYTLEKSISKDRDSFGKGNIRGVAAPESANNSAANGAFVPLLTLGVPGSATTAVVLVALVGLNVTPGPLLIQNHPDVFWGLIASMYVGNLMLLALNLPLVGLFVRMLMIPQWCLMPAVIVISFIAIYAINNSAFDLLLISGIGVVGYLMRKFGFPIAPAVLGLVLGHLMEVNLRQALALSDGDWGILFASPITAVLWVLVALGLMAPLFPHLRRKLRAGRG
ncbi:tripartite tricarboxylate transporter permease [Szabonella alba]|uniref:Tripartite tricarboxylate transporter permease n=1 Tax=Szabonella alba TaxID=2804194 RepID=A0A8K0Y2A6_9RHOB|nr:tripartite tricarboxylate transporter permease [Szabonella alba]MBL4919263.1 tripartite tricarboxylate transporter permease [Szabonella alba]